MAKEKLLFILMLLVLAMPTLSFAALELEQRREDLEWAKGLAKGAMEISINEIKQKYSELQQMPGEVTNEDDLPGIDEDMQLSAPILKVFVSNSMNRSLLKSYVDEAKRYGAVLVFKGLPNGSWMKLSELVADITGGSDEAVAIQIDDFNEFDIRSVPSFVLSKANDLFRLEDQNITYDKVVGNIGIREALELIAASGELKSEANWMLKNASNRRW